MNVRRASIHGVLALLVFFAIGSASAPWAQEDPYPSQRPTGTTSGIPKGPAPAPTCSDPCEVFRWLQRAPVPDPFGFPGAGVEGAAVGAFVDPNDSRAKLWVAHGFGLTGDDVLLRVHDIYANTWVFGPPASVARSEGSGQRVGAKLYSIGGRSIIPAVEIFDPVAGTWSAGAPMPTPRSGFGTVVRGGKIHTIGGRTAGQPQGPAGSMRATHEVYDPGTDSWSALAPLPTPIGDITATAVHGGKIYVFGGWNGASTLATTYIYGPGTNTWSLGAPMPTPRSGAIAGNMNDRLIVIGGLDNTFGNSAATEVYDPATDTWCIGPPKPNPASEMASGGVTSGLGIHAVGSGSYGLAADYHDVLFSINRDPCDPLLVELEYFRGTVTKRGVRLDWKTTFELEHAGFRILRHAGDDPEKNVVFEVLTDELIHGRGDELVGAEYEFLDTSKGLAGTVTYYLEDIDIFGVRTLHDPIVIEIPDGRRKGDRARK